MLKASPLKNLFDANDRDSLSLSSLQNCPHCHPFKLCFTPWKSLLNAFLVYTGARIVSDLKGIAHPRVFLT